MHYGQDLVSLAIFGSYARGENCHNSDIDLLIVLDEEAPHNRRQRIDDFVRNIEASLDELSAPCGVDGIQPDISPIILQKQEAGRFLPIYLDMVTHHVLIEDRGHFLKDVLDHVAQKMKAWGSIKKSIGGHWYWEIKPGLKWGETIDYDQ